MTPTSYGFRLVAVVCLITTTIEGVFAQYPTSCTGVSQRANSNGGANSCPNVNGTSYAANFLATSYATVPVTSKTGNLQLQYTGSNPGLLPYAITKVWLTSGSTTIQGTTFGPAGVPAVSAGNTQVNYCFYGSNLPTAGTLSLEMTNPQTGVVWGICSYDAGCNSNCVVVANPAALPVHFASFTAGVVDGGVELKWTTAQEENNRGFAIERREGDGDFVQIGYVGSSNVGGNSVMTTSYSYIDKTVVGGDRVAYRLRQEDLDAKYEYSSVVYVGVPRMNVVNVFATGRQVNVVVPGSAGFEGGAVVVYDSQGRTVRKLGVVGGGMMTIGGLPGGSVYYVVVRMGSGEVRVRKGVYVE